MLGASFSSPKLKVKDASDNLAEKEVRFATRATVSGWKNFYLLMKKKKPKKEVWFVGGVFLSRVGFWACLCMTGLL